MGESPNVGKSAWEITKCWEKGNHPVFEKVSAPMIHPRNFLPKLRVMEGHNQKTDSKPIANRFVVQTAENILMLYIAKLYKYISLSQYTRPLYAKTHIRGYRSPVSVHVL